MKQKSEEKGKVKRMRRGREDGEKGKRDLGTTSSFACR
jgi:hypothetical protein